jgi:hypothetical protein
MDAGSTKRCSRFRQASSMAIAVCVAISGVPAVAYANAIGPGLLTEFNQDRVLSKGELDRQRGGFFLPNGAMVSLGVEIQQYVNNQLENQVTYTVKNTFSVTQTTPQGTTIYTQPVTLASVVVPSLASTGTTTLTGQVLNGAVQSVIQNTANNTAIKSVTTVTLNTQGLASLFRNNMMAGNILSAIQLNATMFHH